MEPKDVDRYLNREIVNYNKRLNNKEKYHDYGMKDIDYLHSKSVMGNFSKDLLLDVEVELTEGL